MWVGLVVLFLEVLEGEDFAGLLLVEVALVAEVAQERCREEVFAFGLFAEAGEQAIGDPLEGAGLGVLTGGGGGIEALVAVGVFVGGDGSIRGLMGGGGVPLGAVEEGVVVELLEVGVGAQPVAEGAGACLLYTSDAADE